jgi:hypothetical protein
VLPVLARGGKSRALFFCEKRSSSKKQSKGTHMELLIWAGAILTAIGLVGIVWCILMVTKARKSGLDDTELRARLQRAVIWNMGAFLMSAMGLMMVVLGILLS